MKKILAFALAIVFIAGFAAVALADTGTVTVSKIDLKTDVRVVKFSFIANSTGAVPSTSTTVETCASRQCYPMPNGRIGYIAKVVTDPGSTAPTDDYDITLTDDTTGADLLGGEGADRDTANTEEVVPKIGNAYAGNVAFTSFTLNISSNSVNAATGDVYVYIVWGD
jgi:hypothetical protein